MNDLLLLNQGLLNPLIEKPFLDLFVEATSLYVRTQFNVSIY